MADPKVNINLTANTTQAQQAINSFKGSFTELKSKIDLVKQGFDTFTRAAGEAYALLKEGAALAAARERFDKLAESIDTTADSLLTKMKDAAGGMVSDAELMAGATDIMSLGLAKNEDDVVRLISVMGQLGWSLQETVLTLANDSKMRLDALGLSVEDVTKRTREYEAAGIAASEAFDLAVIDAAEAKIELEGDAVDRTGAAYQRLETHIKNVIDAKKEDAAVTTESTAKGLVDFLDASVLVNRAYEDGNITMGQRIKLIESMRFGILDEADALEALNEAMIENGRTTLELTDEELALAAASESFDRAMLNSITTMESATETTGLLEGAVTGLTEGYDAAKTSAALLNEGIDMLSDTMLEAERIKLAIKLATEDLTDAERAQLILQYGELENIAALNQAYADDVITKYEWIAAVSAGTDAVAELARQVQNAAGDYDINFQINVKGSIPNTNPAYKTGGGSPKDEAGGGFHDGADFIVPPGYSNDSYGPLWVESGERVQVTPAADMAKGGGSGSGGTTVLVMLDGKEIAAHVQTMSGRDYRTARNSGARLTGR